MMDTVVDRSSSGRKERVETSNARIVDDDGESSDVLVGVVAEGSGSNNSAHARRRQKNNQTNNNFHELINPSFLTKKGEAHVDEDVDSIERGNGGPPRNSRWRLGQASASTVKSVAPSRRARIEPKTYFAAERTYIQWISAALLLVTVASILNALATDSTHWTERTMMILASLTTIYALVIYFRRLYLLERALPYGYQDHVGPIVLTTSLLVGIITLLYFSVSQHRADMSKIDLALVTAKVEVGKCMQRSFSGVSVLEFQPSDIVVDTERDIFLIPSITEIRSLSRQATIDDVHELRMLGVVDQEDLEALTFHEDGTLYAVSEGPASSTLLAFRWTGPPYSLNPALELVGRWRLKGVANSEGIVYLSEDPVHMKGQRLLISSDSSTDPLKSDVHVFDIPSLPPDLTEDQPELVPVTSLNSGLISGGFPGQSSTKISAMASFEGILYILHDNARVIRGWDIVSGVIVSEWKTPRVGEEFNKQWEGISIERVDTATIVLHMTLDTPPQIWSFYMEQTSAETANGRATWKLPSCAQAF